jgi:diguanylate cyclase (GGDEF)-like protein
MAKGFFFSGENRIDFANYEFFTRGFDPEEKKPFFTNMYYDASNDAWMTTIASPGPVYDDGKRKIIVCTDVVLNDLMNRTARAPITGSYCLIFNHDTEGTLIYGPGLTDKIIQSKGKASIKSLGLMDEYKVLEASQKLKPDQISTVNTDRAIVAVGAIPDTPWIMAVFFPRDLMWPAIKKNLLIVIILGLTTLFVEILLINSILRKKVASPLARLMQAMREINRQDEGNQQPVMPKEQNEITALTHEFEGMSGRVRQAHDQLEQKVLERTSELEILNQKLHELSITDKLTGISNRRHFDTVLANEWERALRTGSQLSLIMGDVDWFKKYNDRLGHQSGDDCLRQVAVILTKAAQRGSDLAARYGGEEFAVLLPNTTSEQAQIIALKIMQEFQDLNLPHPDSPFGYVTMSLGIAAAVPEPGVHSGSLVKSADSALYTAKTTGRNRCIVGKNSDQEAVS